MDKRKFDAYHRFYVEQGERPGQAMMNALADTDPGLYDEVTGSDADCFYDDSRIPAFVRRVFTLKETK